MEPSCFGFNKVTSIPRMKLEDSKETKREKEKQSCLEDDAMQEIEGTSLLTKVPTPWPRTNQFILPFQVRSTQSPPSFLTHFENMDDKVSKLLLQLESNQFENLGEVSETLGNLTSLNLHGCSNLKELPMILGFLTSLVTLNLSYCENLWEVPDTLGNLTSLVTLNLDGCKNLKELPDTLGNLSSLVTLDFFGCESLEELPDTLGNLTSLVTLYLSGCKNLKELPDTLGNLTSLVTLILLRCESLEELPDTLGNLTSLVTLSLSGCKNLKELPDTLGNLTSLVTLDLSGCKNLKELPDTLDNLTSLVTLDFFGCESLEELPDTLGNFTSLVTLNLGGCENLKELPDTLGNLTSLVTLDFFCCENLKELPDTLGNLTSLVTLYLSGCKNLKELPDTLGNLISLVTLILLRCESLEELPDTLCNLTSLVTLDLSGCENLKKLPDTLGNLTSLVTLDLSGCKNLKELPDTLGNLTSLVTLDFFGCESLEELPDTLGNLTSLVTLNLGGCENLKELPDTLGNLTSLVTLDFFGCENLKELPDTLGNLSSLVTLNLSGCENLKKLPDTLGNLSSLVILNWSYCENPKGKIFERLVVQNDLIAGQESQSGTNYEEALSSVTIEDLGAAGNLTKPGNTESRTSSNESLDQAQHDPMEFLEKLKKARGGSDPSTLTMLRTWQPTIAIIVLVGVGIILSIWLAYFMDGFKSAFLLIPILLLFSVMLNQTYTEAMKGRFSLKSLLWLGHGTIVPYASIVAMAYIEGLCSFTFLIHSTILGVSLLVLILGVRSSVHLHLLWYNATGKSLRPCNMLKAQYYSQNLRGALFISKDAPDGCWSYHPNFSLTGQRRENDKDFEDEFEVSGYTYKCRYQYPTSFFEVTMRGKLIKSMETPLEPEVHTMFIRLIRRWKHKAEDGVFYGMQIVWGVNVTHCLDVKELYKLLVEGHVPVQYVNGPYTKALVMGEREILENMIKVITTIIGFFGVMYVNYGGHMVVNGMALIFLLIVGGLHIRTLHLCTYMDVESKIFSYKYLRWFKYWEYRGQVLCPDRYCMEVMGHPVHVEGGKHYAELTRSDFSTGLRDPLANSMLTFIGVPYFRIEIGKCVCSFVRFPEAPGYVSFYIDSKVHDSTSFPYRGCMSETCQDRFLTLLTWWGEGTISFVSSKAIKEGARSAHCTSLLDIFKWFADDPYRSLDEIFDCHAFRIRRLGCGFENGLWLVHGG